MTAVPPDAWHQDYIPTLEDWQSAFSAFAPTPADLNVKDFGARCDGVTDDTPAFNAAMQAASGAGGRILIPGNIVLGNAVISKPVTIQGTGGDAAQATIRPLSASSTVFDVASPFVTISDLAIGPASPAIQKQTAGTYINVRSTSHRFRAERLTLTEFHEGITLGNMSTAELTGIRGYLYSTGLSQSSAGIHVTGGFDVKLIDLSLAGPTTDTVNCKAGVWVENCGDCMIANSSIISMGTDLLVNPGDGQVVASLWASNTFFDTAYRGVDMTATGSGAILRARLSDVWASSHTTHGMRFGLGVDGVDIESLHVFLNQCGAGANAAVEVTGGKNIRFRGGQIAGNLNSGFYVAAGVSDWSMDGVTIGPTSGVLGNGGAAIFVPNGSSDRYAIRNNVVSGNGLGAITDGGTGAQKAIFGNIGDPNAWLPWVSTVAPASGSGMTATTVSRYKKIDRIVHFQLNIAITAAGTGSGYVLASLPFAAQDYNGFGGSEGNSGRGLAANIVPGANSLRIVLSDGTSAISASNRLLISGSYEATA